MRGTKARKLRHIATQEFPLDEYPSSGYAEGTATFYTPTWRRYYRFLKRSTSKGGN